MDIKDLKVIAYTFARYSYQFDSNKPYYASKAAIYANKDNCENAIKQVVNHNYNTIKQLCQEMCGSRENKWYTLELFERK